MRNNQKGFGAVEGMLILIIVGLICFVGWYVLNAKNKTNKTLGETANTSVTSVVTPKTTSKTTTPQAATSSQDPAVAFTQDFYNKYLAATTHDARDKLVNQYGTENSIPTYEDAQDADTILCGQNVPNSVSVTRDGGSDSNPTIKVTEKYDSPVNLTVQLIKFQGSYRLDSVTCPGA